MTPEIQRVLIILESFGIILCLVKIAYNIVYNEMVRRHEAIEAENERYQAELAEEQARSYAMPEPRRVTITHEGEIGPSCFDEDGRIRGLSGLPRAFQERGGRSTTSPQPNRKRFMYTMRCQHCGHKIEFEHRGIIRGHDHFTIVCRKCGESSGGIKWSEFRKKIQVQLKEV